MGLVDLLLKSWVTGRIVVPLVKGELEEDLGERGVRGLGPSELWAPGVSGEEIFGFECRDRELRSKFGTVDCLNGILGGVAGQFANWGWIGRPREDEREQEIDKYRQESNDTKEEDDQPAYENTNVSNPGE